MPLPSPHPHGNQLTRFVRRVAGPI